MSDTPQSTESDNFRRALIRALKSDMRSFDLIKLQEEHGVCQEVVDQSARAVFMSQCVRASSDGQVTDDEQNILYELGNRLQISQPNQEKYLAAAKNSVYQDELREALEDGVISDDEAKMLQDLCRSLGLPLIDRMEVEPKPQRRENKSEKQTEQRQLSQAQKDCRDKHRKSTLGLAIIFCLVMGCPTILLICIGSGRTASIAFYFILLPIVIFCILLVAIAYLVAFIFARCHNCGAHWAVEANGEYQRESSMWGWDTIYIEYECIRCGWRKWRRRSEGGGGG